MKIVSSDWTAFDVLMSCCFFQFFNQVLIIDEVDNTYAISSKIYDLIYELNVICPRILLSVLPQLECKLKSGQESERLSE